MFLHVSSVRIPFAPFCGCPLLLFRAWLDYLKGYHHVCFSFSADRSAGSLLVEFAGETVAELPTTNGPFATGDGVRMGRAIGAHLLGMEWVQVHPTGFVNPKDRTSST